MNLKIVRFDIRHYIHHYLVMSTLSHPFSHFLRKSGDVLDQIEVMDVHLVRRDGSDVMLVKTSREESIRESLNMSVLTLASLSRIGILRPKLLDALVEALPWISWLDPKDRELFFEDFIQTAQSCHAVSQYEPLEKLLVQWKRSAEISNNPQLLAILIAPRGEDQVIPLSRPK